MSDGWPPRRSRSGLWPRRFFQSPERERRGRPPVAHAPGFDQVILARILRAFESHGYLCRCPHFHDCRCGVTANYRRVPGQRGSDCVPTPRIATPWPATAPHHGNIAGGNGPGAGCCRLVVRLGHACSLRCRCRAAGYGPLRLGPGGRSHSQPRASGEGGDRTDGRRSLRRPIGPGARLFPMFLRRGAVTRPTQAAMDLRPEDTMFLSSTAVAGKRVYAAGCQRDLGGYTGLLACLDAETGQPLWQTTQAAGEVLRPFFSSPALTADGKYLVVGQGLHADDHCSLLCFDTATGHLHWALEDVAAPRILAGVERRRGRGGAGAIEGPNGQPVGDPGFVLAVRIADGQELCARRSTTRKARRPSTTMARSSSAAVSTAMRLSLSELTLKTDSVNANSIGSPGVRPWSSRSPVHHAGGRSGHRGCRK